MIKLLASLIILFVPITTLGASYTFTCSDNLVTNASCSNDVFTFIGGTTYFYDNNVGYIDVVNNGTLYFTTTYTGSGQASWLVHGDQNTTSDTFTGALTEEPITAGGADCSGIGCVATGKYNVIGIDARYAPSNTFSGDLTICVDDDGTSCTGGGGGSTASSTMASTTEIIALTQLTGLTFIVALLALGLSLWIFRLLVK